MKEAAAGGGWWCGLAKVLRWVRKVGLESAIFCVGFGVCEFRESNREMRVLEGRGFTVERAREVFKLVIRCKSCHTLS